MTDPKAFNELSSLAIHWNIKTRETVHKRTKLRSCQTEVYETVSEKDSTIIIIQVAGQIYAEKALQIERQNWVF